MGWNASSASFPRCKGRKQVLRLPDSAQTLACAAKRGDWSARKTGFNFQLSGGLKVKDWCHLFNEHGTKL